ncbi:MAG: SMI1/KNR4 family protein [Gilvibacter sp.]
MKNVANFIISELKPYEKYGTTQQQNGTKLIGKAPHIAPMAWLHSIFRSLETIEVNIIESELNTDIPKDYAEFLLFTNGLDLFNGTLSLFGRRTHYDRSDEINNRQPFALGITNIYEKPFNSKESYFFVGSYNWDGSLVFIDKVNNRVHRCDRVNADILNSWSNFNDFIIAETLRLKSLHHEDGTLKNSSITTIPS